MLVSLMYMMYKLFSLQVMKVAIELHQLNC